MSAWLDRLSAPVLTLCCVASLALRVLFLLVVQPDFHAVEDYNIALHLARGDGFAYGGFERDFYPTALKAPVYPLFLAAFIVAFGDSAKWVVALVQHSLFAFAPLLFAAIGARCRAARIGKLAGLLFLLHPSYFYYPTVLESTSLFVPLALLWLWALGSLAERFPRRREAFAFGSFSGALALVQPVATLPIAATIGFLFRNRLRPLAFIALGALAPIAVWTTRNAIVFGTFIPTKSPFYMNLYVGLLPEYSGAERFQFLERDHVRRMDSLRRALGDVEMEPHFKDIFWNAIRQKPSLYALKTLWQAALYWFVPPRYFENFSLGFVVVRLLPVLTLNALFVWGTLKLWKSRRALAMSVLLVLLYFTAIYALSHAANVRFKLDIEWLELFACAAAFADVESSRV